MALNVKVPEVKARECIYVIVDRLRKYAHFIPHSSSVRKGGVKQVIVNHVLKLHRFLRSIITERDPEVGNAFWRAFMTQSGLDKNMENHE